MWGTARLLKLFPGNRAPYQSVLRIEGLPLGEIVNKVLTNSYQVNSAVLVSDRADRSAMLHQLPPIPNRETYEYSDAALHRRREGIEQGLTEVLARSLEGEREVVEAFASLGFRRLTDRRVRLYCSCSRERMIRGIRSISNASVEELFDPGQTELEVTCEYCRTGYRISREELSGPGERPN